MSKTSRLVGIDLCRGLAAFAVILVHSGDESWGIPISDQAIQFRYLFYFAVPFFLAASFYFSTKKLPLNIDGTFWQKKFKRIVVPYLLWSIFYVVLKTVIFTLTNNQDQVQELLSDPLAIVFLGAASYHLYFIPLLLAGTILLYLANYLSRQRNSTIILSLLTIFSLVVYQLLMLTKNDFDLGSYIAFPNLLQQLAVDSLFYQPWRIILVNIAWIIRCLPYFFIALLINHVLKQNKSRLLYGKTSIAVISVIFVLADVLGQKYLPASLSEIIIAYSLLLFGIAISKHLPDSNLIVSLGSCSFGIYLIHPVIKSAIEIILIKFSPEITQSVSIFSMLTYAILSFLGSWIFILLIQKNKLTAQYI